MVRSRRVAARPLILSFESAKGRAKADTCDARPVLDVMLLFVQLLERIGAHDAIEGEAAPFVVVMPEARRGVLETVLDFAPREGTTATSARAQRAGLEAARLAPNHLERRDAGPAAIRSAAKKLAVAVARLPSTITVRLRGAVEASLSDLARAEPAEAVLSVESFRAKILRAGGAAPRVQLKVSGLDRPITLDAPETLARLAGQTLYADADVTAKLERTKDDRILYGTLTELRIVDEGDPVAAFDRWYQQAGRPWSRVKDIERGLGRG